MRKKIVISALLNQIQVGILENGRLVEYYWEQKRQERLLGNIYKGRVKNVLPGMEAAFVDIGVEKNAFLYIADLFQRGPQQGIEDLLRVGDSILVQVLKEAEGHKGPRVTTEIGLPGRYLVLLPFQAQAGVSRQIVNGEERGRLKAIAEQIRPAKMGLIIRTVAAGCGQKELKKDLTALLREWRSIKRKAKRCSRPTLVYGDYDLIHRILRDFLTAEVTEIVVDSKKLRGRVLAELKDLNVKYPVNVEYYAGKVSLFESLGLIKTLKTARNKRVWLNCGGYLVFDQTEALLSIDVNTGKNVGGQDLRETVLKTNLEAAQEIAHQLRLRNIGGIVLIDFIDMPLKDQEAVLEKLTASLGGDKTRTNLLGFTRLGLFELTRQKSKRLLSEILDVPCPLCGGTGRVSASETVALQIATEVYSLAQEDEVEAILIRCPPAVGARLRGADCGNLAVLEKDLGKSIYIKGDDSLPLHHYELVCGTEERIEKEAAKTGAVLGLRAICDVREGR